MTEVQVAQRGKGSLRVFNEAGVLAAADVHVALRLGALGGEAAEDGAAGDGAGGARGALRLGVPGPGADPGGHRRRARGRGAGGPGGAALARGRGRARRRCGAARW